MSISGCKRATVQFIICVCLHNYSFLTDIICSEWLKFSYICTAEWNAGYATQQLVTHVASLWWWSVSRRSFTHVCLIVAMFVNSCCHVVVSRDTTTWQCHVVSPVWQLQPASEAASCAHHSVKLADVASFQCVYTALSERSFCHSLVDNGIVCVLMWCQVVPSSRW